MEHGRFLATISSATVLDSSFCAAVPTVGEQLDVVRYFLSLANCSDQYIIGIEANLKAKANGGKIKLSDLYKKVREDLQLEGWFSDDDYYSLTTEELASYLLDRYCDGYKGANEHWRECYYFVMCEVLRHNILDLTYYTVDILRCKTTNALILITIKKRK